MPTNSIIHKFKFLWRQHQSLHCNYLTRVVFFGGGDSRFSFFFWIQNGSSIHKIHIPAGFFRSNPKNIQYLSVFRERFFKNAFLTSCLYYWTALDRTHSTGVAVTSVPAELLLVVSCFAFTTFHFHVYHDCFKTLEVVRKLRESHSK